MIKIYYTVFDKRLIDEKFYNYLNVLPDVLKKDVLKYQRWQDGHASLFGKLLLKRGLSDISDVITLDQIKFSDYGRPFFIGPIDFNISHTSSCVMCAITEDGRVGLDVEVINNTELSHFKNCFSANEWNEITTNMDPLDKFFHFWTKKESVIKADGRGLSISLNDFETIENDVILNNIKWKIEPLNVSENYKAHLAYNNEQDIEMILIDF